MAFLLRIAALVLALTALGGPALAQSRIKDIVSVEGVRTNQLTGVGIVTGLNGTGDSLRNSPMTRQSLESLLEQFGINIREANANTRNIAIVMVTAELPPFAVPGSRMDVNVSTMGDARNLMGGTLLITPLLGADGQAYAVAQGTVQTGSVSGSGASGSSVTRGVPTAGRIAGGASIERETGFQLASMSQLRLALRNPDFSTAQRVAQTINAAFPGSAYAENGTVVTVRPPAGRDMASYIASIENLPVTVDSPARVIVDEVNGVIVMGENVRISTVAIAQGNLTISVQEMPWVSQPAPFSDGRTVVVPDSSVSFEEDRGREMRVLNGGTSLSELVNGLNALGVSPRDMISILQAVRAAGALQAEIEVM